MTELAGNEIAARIPVGPDIKRLILGADEAYVRVMTVRVPIIGTADHRVAIKNYGRNGIEPRWRPALRRGFPTECLR